MDLALKRRLIGATGLIILAIIFLPMLFDGTVTDEKTTLSLDIPVPPERDFETRIVALDKPTLSSEVADAVGKKTQSAATTSSAPTEATAVVAEPNVAEDSNTIATVDTSSPARIDAITDPAIPSDRQITDPATIINTQSQSNLSTAPTDPVNSEPAVNTQGRFFVNLGSYANPVNAEQLRAKLKVSGLSVLSEQFIVDGKPIARLRLGPFLTRGLAENARLKAKAVRADLPLSIIEVDDSPVADAALLPSASTRGSAYAVQVEVLTDLAKANASRDRLRTAGFAAFIETLNTEKGVVYRVRVGPETDRSNAEKVKAGLRQRFGLEAIIVNYP